MSPQATSIAWYVVDRSWARRARGGVKRRPDLLNADFSNDRERPASPSSILETSSLLSTPEEEVKPKYSANQDL